MSERPKRGSYWRHFKGGLYRVENVARSADDCRVQVVYSSVADGEWWIRDLIEWHEQVRGKPRFQIESGL